MLDDRIRCTHEGTVAVVKPWTLVIRTNKSLTDFCDVLLHGQFWVENESNVPSRIREGDVVRANSNRIREGNGGRLQGRRKEKKKSFCFVVVTFEMIFVHPCFYVVSACIVSLVTLVTSLRGADFCSCVSSAKSWWFSEWLAMISEGGVVYRTKRTGWALRHTVHELWWWRRRVIDWSRLISVWEIWLKPLECSRLNAKNRVQAGEENMVVSSVISGRKIQQKNRNVVIVQSRENIVYNT